MEVSHKEKDLLHAYTKLILTEHQTSPAHHVPVCVRHIRLPSWRLIFSLNELASVNTF